MVSLIDRFGSRATLVLSLSQRTNVPAAQAEFYSLPCVTDNRSRSSNKFLKRGRE